jgi:hypothetical protein
MPTAPLLEKDPPESREGRGFFRLYVLLAGLMWLRLADAKPSGRERFSPPFGAGGKAW